MAVTNTISNYNIVKDINRKKKTFNNKLYMPSHPELRNNIFFVNSSLFFYKLTLYYVNLIIQFYISSLKYSDILLMSDSKT